jgi:hypothetical protein
MWLGSSGESARSAVSRENAARGANPLTLLIGTGYITTRVLTITRRSSDWQARRCQHYDLRTLTLSQRSARPLLISSPMSKSSRRSRRAAPDRSAATDIVSQLECAIRHPQATAIGALVGGLVPWFARTLAHAEVPATWAAGNHGLAFVMIAVVLGCACFSAITVYKFGRATFGDARKAIGFTLAIEGVMLISQGATSAVALAILIAINALANGSAIALARQATCRRREAAARGAATRRSRTTAAAPRARAPFVADDTAVRPATPVKTPDRWMPVIDAEIVSEERLLS